MEAQLAAYRQKKAKEQQNENISNFISNIFGKKETHSSSNGHPTHGDEPRLLAQNRNPQTSTKPHYFDEAATLGDGVSPFNRRLIYGLKVVLWLIVWGLFIEVGFGAVFFILSILLFVYFNTRTGPKRGDAPSAYSVFNPNCERIDGTITAEQFEKELRYGAISVH